MGLLNKLGIGAKQIPEQADAAVKAVPTPTPQAPKAPTPQAPKAPTPQAPKAPTPQAPQAPMTGTMDQLKQPRQIRTEVGFKSEQYRRSKVSDILFEMSVNNMLFQPHTPIINLASNTFTALAAPLDTAFTVLTSRFNKPGDRVRASEALSQAMGFMHSTMLGIKYLGERAKTILPGNNDSVADTLKKIGAPAGLDNTNRLELNNRAMSSQNLELNPKSISGMVADGMGSIINIPGSILNSSDMMFKLFHADQARFAWAARETANGRFASFDEAYRLAIDDPKFSKEAVERADYYTYMGRPSAPTLSWITDTAMEKLPGMRWVIPFKRSIANIAEQTLERSPLILASPTLAKKLVSKDPAERATAQARLLTGLTITSVLGYSLKDYLHGEAPSDPNMRAAWENVYGPQDTLIFKDVEGLGTVKLELDSLGVYGQFLKILGRYNQWNTNKRASELYETDAVTSMKTVKEIGQFVGPVTEVLFDSFYGRNVMEFSALLTKAVEQNDPRQLMKWLERTGVRTIPIVGTGMMRNEAKRQDPYQHKANELGDQLKMQIPGLSKLIKYDYAWNGKKMLASGYRGPGARTIANYVYDPDDPVEKFLVDIKAEISEPQEYLPVKVHKDSQKTYGVLPVDKLKLTDEEWDTYNTWHDTGIPEAGIPGLSEFIKDRVMDNPNIEYWEDQAKAKLVSTVVEEYRAVLRPHLEALPSIQERMAVKKKALAERIKKHFEQ